MKKSQTPNPKSQENPKLQISNQALSAPRFGAWVLGFVWDLGFGIWSFLPRGLSLFLGSFSLLNLAGNLRSPHFDANLWWIDLRFLSPTLARLLLLVSALCLLTFALRPPRSAWRRLLTASCATALLTFVVTNAVQFYRLLAHGSIASAIPIPLSLFVAAALTLILFATLSPPGQTAASKPSNSPALKFGAWDFFGGWSLGFGASSSPVLTNPPNHQPLLPTLAVSLACLMLFPLAQMFCFGKTDYRRPADAAVVLGARVYADGRPSDALADRVRTACQLYRDGLARKLLFSGGPGDGAVPESQSMKRMALQLGVKPDDILLDENGLNTQATVKNSAAVFSSLHASRILVVSHFYHLPRIKLAYQRAGWDVYTVPARESYLLRQMPYNMVREIAALWVYYLRPLASASAS